MALREGTPAQWSVEARGRAIARLQSGLRGLSIHLAARTETSDPRCARFHRNLDETIRQLIPALDASPSAFDLSSSEGEFWDGLRLRVLQSAFFGLTRAFRDGADGGYDTLNAQVKVSCPVYRRPAIADNMRMLARDLAEYMREGLGGPGLDRWDQIGWRLLAYAKRAESHRNRRDWYVTGGTVAVSLLAWRYAPKAIERVAGRTLPWLYRKPVQMVAVPLVYGIEGLAVYHTLEWLGAAEYQALEDGLGSWDDLMAEIEALLSAPKDSPELGFRYVNSVKGLLAKAFRLKIEDGPTLARADEAIALAGRPPAVAAVVLRERLSTDHGIQVECGLSVFRCVRGLQAIARLVYDDRVKPLEPGEDQTLRFEITREAGVTVATAVETMTVRAPANANAGDLAALVEVVRASAPYLQRVGQARAFTRDLADLQRALPMLVEFAPELNRAERWRATRMLSGLARRRPDLFRRHADVLRVGRVYHPPTEENLRLVEGVRGDVDPAELERALADRWAEPLQQEWLRTRVEAEHVAAEIQALTGFPARCQPDGYLRVRECASTLRAWLELARARAPVTKRPVDIYARRSLNAGWDLRDGRLGIAPGFDSGDLPPP